MTNIPKADLEELSERANMIRETISTRGWTQVIRPALVGRREGLIKTMLGKKYENLSEITYLQQSANVIEAILTLIESTLAQGEEADNLLKDLALNEAGQEG